MVDATTETAVVSTNEIAAYRPAPDAVAIVAALLKGAAGLGAAATALGFIVTTGRFVAAELPVTGGLEAVGVRTVITNGVRALGVLVMICVLSLVVVPFVLELISQKSLKTNADVKANADANL